MRKKIEAELLRRLKDDATYHITQSTTDTILNIMRTAHAAGELDDEQWTILFDKELERFYKKHEDENKKEYSVSDIDTSNAIENLLNISENIDFETQLVILKCLELEDKVQALTLTSEQYNTWLSTSAIFINTKQFSTLYGLSATQQRGLRAKTTDPLPIYKIPNDNSNNSNTPILYDRKEVEKWLANYQGRMNLSDAKRRLFI